MGRVAVLADRRTAALFAGAGALPFICERGEREVLDTVLATADIDVLIVSEELYLDFGDVFERITDPVVVPVPSVWGEMIVEGDVRGVAFNRLSRWAERALGADILTRTEER